MRLSSIDFSCQPAEGQAGINPMPIAGPGAKVYLRLAPPLPIGNEFKQAQVYGYLINLFF